MNVGTCHAVSIEPIIGIMTASPRAWIALAVLTLPTLLLSIDATVLLLALPALSRDLAPTASETLWIVDAYGFAIAILLIPMGALGDRIGRRRLLLIGAVAFAAASAFAAFAPSAEALIAARVLLGAAAATLMPSTLALLSTLFPDERARGLAIGVWAAAFSVGIALGPVVGGAVLEVLPWGAVFLLAIPIMALLVATGPFLLPEHRDTTTKATDLPSVALALATAAGLVGGLKLLAAAEGSPLLGGGILAAGVVLGVLFIRRQRRVAVPLIDPALFRDRGFTSVILLMLVGASTLGIYLFVTDALQVDGLTPLQAGLSLLPPAFALVIASLAAPILAGRLGIRFVLTAGFVAMSVGALVMALSGGRVVPVLVGFGIYYLGIGPLMALGTDVIVGRSEPGRAGSAAALSESTMEFGIAFGLATLGSLGAAATGTVHGEGFVPSEGLPIVGATVALASVGLAVASAIVLGAHSRRRETALVG